MTTAAVENAMEMPAACNDAPIMPRLPNVANKAKPATTGGSDSGNSTSTRTAATPFQSRASNRAIGTPRNTSMTVAITQVRTLNHSAS
jgi:hypothetical protein